MNPTPSTDERKPARHKAFWIFIAVLLAALGALAVERRKLDLNVPVASFQNPDAGAQGSGVGCVGRIAPENGTFFVSAQASGGRIPVIEQLRIKEGQELSVGEIMAVLDSRSHLELAVREAQARVNLAEVRLVRVKAGVNPGESEVIKAEIARLEILRDAAQRDYSRNEPLFKQDFISMAQIDTLATRVRESEALIRQAKDRLTAISVVRKEDTDLADAEVRAAEADLERTQLEVETSYVRSPSRARVLRVIAHTGEPIGPAGIAELAETQRMMVIAEVYETDIPRVHIGQKATVKSELLPHPLEGAVAYISPQVRPQQTISGVPGAPTDARVFEVRIKVPNAEVLASRISGRVDVVIAP